MKNKQELIEGLISLDIFIQNEYFYQYIELVNKCFNNKWEKYCCQTHHIIPRCYYKFMKVPCDNSESNKVIMFHKQHLLAHYYLYLCAKPNWFKEANALAFRHALNHRWFKIKNEEYLNERKFIEKLDEYQKIVEQANKAISFKNKGKPHIISKETKHKISKTLKGHLVSESTRQKISKACKGNTPPNKGKKSYTNGVYNIFLYENEKIPQGFYKGSSRTKTSKKRPPLDQAHKEKISNSLKGYKCINNGIQEKHIFQEELEDYLSNGWFKGGLPKHKKS